MDFEVNKINWFPGHMAKAIRQINESINNVDLIICVLDARAIKTSDISDFLSLDKPTLKIALKSDIADIKKSNLLDVLIGSIKDKSFKQKIISAIEKKLSVKKEKYISKGLKNPTFYIMVVGLPNVGKSSLINFLANKNLTVVENRAGVTKKQNVIKINDTLYIQDNPGIMYKNIKDIQSGYILSLVNCIKKDILPLKDVTEFAYNFLKAKYYDIMNKLFSISINTSYLDFIEIISKKYGFLEEKKAIEFFYNQLINGTLLRVNYEA